MRDRIGSSELHGNVEDSDYKVASHRRRFPAGAFKKPTPMKTPTVGIDMAKLTFCAALWFNRERFFKAEFTNNVAGFRGLRTWLRKHGAGGSLRVAMESTSTYAEALLEWLYAAGYSVFLLNPEQVSHYSRACGRRNKTDPADAVTIAAFIASHDATPWQPPPPEQKDLRSLTRARAQVVETARTLALQLQTARGTGAPAPASPARGCPAHPCRHRP